MDNPVTGNNGHTRHRTKTKPSRDTDNIGHTRHRMKINHPETLTVPCLVYPMLSVSLDDCPFLIAPSVFSNVCLHNNGTIENFEPKSNCLC
jgi:hypothetical protein